MPKKVDEQQTDESTRRAKKADIVAMQKRFDAIFTVATNSNMSDKERLDIIVTIAKGKTLEGIIDEAGRKALGLA